MAKVLEETAGNTWFQDRISRMKLAIERKEKSGAGDLYVILAAGVAWTYGCHLSHLCSPLSELQEIVSLLSRVPVSDQVVGTIGNAKKETNEVICMFRGTFVVLREHNFFWIV